MKTKEGWQPCTNCKFMAILLADAEFPTKLATNKICSVPITNKTNLLVSSHATPNDCSKACNLAGK